MNPFVNFNKRSIELPKGCTDLAEVLKAKKCEYCDDIAVPMGGWINDVRWCQRCQRDLIDFTRQLDFSVVPLDATDEENQKYLADQQRERDEFMRERVKNRKCE